MNTQRPQVLAQVLEVRPSELERQDVALLDELAGRLASIGRSYSAMAQQVGAL